MPSIRISGNHKLRKALFVKGIRQGHLTVDEVEDAIPPGLLTAAERWLLYFSLRSADVQLRDRAGRVVTPDDVVRRGSTRRSSGPGPTDFSDLDLDLDLEEGEAEPPGTH